MERQLDILVPATNFGNLPGDVFFKLVNTNDNICGENEELICSFLLLFLFSLRYLSLLSKECINP